MSVDIRTFFTVYTQGICWITAAAVPIAAGAAAAAAAAAAAVTFIDNAARASGINGCFITVSNFNSNSTYSVYSPSAVPRCCQVVVSNASRLIHAVNVGSRQLRSFVSDIELLDDNNEVLNARDGLKMVCFLRLN